MYARGVAHLGSDSDRESAGVSRDFTVVRRAEKKIKTAGNAS